MGPVERFILGQRADQPSAARRSFPGHPGDGVYSISAEQLPSLWPIGLSLLFGSIFVVALYQAIIRLDLQLLAIAILLGNAAAIHIVVVHNHLKVSDWMLRLDESGVAFRTRYRDIRYSWISALRDRLKPQSRWTWSQLEPFSLTISNNALGQGYFATTRITRAKGGSDGGPTDEIRVPLSGLRGIHTREDAEQLVDRLNTWRRHFAPLRPAPMPTTAVPGISASPSEFRPTVRNVLGSAALVIAIVGALLTLGWDQLTAFAARLGPLPTPRFHYEGPSGGVQSAGQRFFDREHEVCVETLPSTTNQEAGGVYCGCLADTMFDYLSTRAYIREDVGYLSHRTYAQIAAARDRALGFATIRCAGALPISIPTPSPAVRW